MTDDVIQQEYYNIKCYVLIFKYYINYINIDMFTTYKKKVKSFIYLLYIF